MFKPAIATRDGCQREKQKVLFGKTIRQIPHVILKARVLPHAYGSGNCILEWQHNYFDDREILKYMVNSETKPR